MIMSHIARTQQFLPRLPRIRRDRVPPRVRALPLASHPHRHDGLRPRAL